MKEHLRGQSFESEEEVVMATKVALKELDKGTSGAAFDGA